jgi:hypothetical protein
LRSELEADVTEMMNRVHPGVNSRFSPEATLNLPKNCSWLGWHLRKPTLGPVTSLPGLQGPWVAPPGSGAACRGDHGTHLPRRLGVIGAHYRRDSNRAGPGTCRTPDGSCVWSAWADGTRPVGTATQYQRVGVSLSGYSNLGTSQWRKVFKK